MVDEKVLNEKTQKAMEIAEEVSKIATHDWSKKMAHLTTWTRVCNVDTYTLSGMVGQELTHEELILATSLYIREVAQKSHKTPEDIGFM